MATGATSLVTSSHCSTAGSRAGLPGATLAKSRSPRDHLNIRILNLIVYGMEYMLDGMYLFIHIYIYS